MELQYYKNVARSILEGCSIESKLILVPYTQIQWCHPHGASSTYTLKNPGRPDNLQMYFDNPKIRFPKRHHFHQEKSRGMAIHFFANHELLAIEMIAAALLIYPDHGNEADPYKKHLYLTLQDEQRHLQLYIDRLKDFGIEFGDYPLNSFFWKKMPELETPSKFLSTLSLTFEAANLDFAFEYSKIFEQVEDFTSAELMMTILKDEIVHVKRGVVSLDQWRGDHSLWEYYLQNLPFPLTPARSKGMTFHPELRRNSGMDEATILNFQNYQDDFKITQRKTWKN